MGGASEELDPHILASILRELMGRSDGPTIVATILWMRLAKDPNPPQPLVDVARECLDRGSNDQIREHERTAILEAAILGDGGETFARKAAANIASRRRYVRRLFRDERAALLILLKRFPVPTLDAILRPSDDVTRPIEASGLGIQGSIGDVVDLDTWLAWCAIEPDSRFEAAAGLVSFMHKDGDVVRWTDKAFALMANAPNPIAVLQVFVSRFFPNSWNGSRAETAAVHLPLFDALRTSDIPLAEKELDEIESEFHKWLVEARERELTESRDREERFEWPG